MFDDLIKRAKSGDESAENEILSIFSLRFRLISKHRIWSIEDAEEIAQESCITVLEKYKDEYFSKGIEEWAYGILRMKIGNYLQRKKVRNKVHSMSTDKIDILHEAKNPTNEIKIRLSDCMKKLIQQYPRYARALNLIYQGFKTKEICKKMMISDNHLYVVLNRGRSLLKNCLETSGI